jgi:hypothetical protein
MSILSKTSFLKEFCRQISFLLVLFRFVFRAVRAGDDATAAGAAGESVAAFPHDQIRQEHRIYGEDQAA